MATRVEEAYSERDQTVDAEGNKFRWQDASVKGANMKTDNGNDIINIDELNEAYARACPRNLAFRVAHGTNFDLGERVGFDPTSRQAVKSDAPNAVPLGVVQHFVQQPTAPFDVAFVFTFESFFCDFDHRGERRGA